MLVINSIAGPWDTVLTVGDNQKTSHELPAVGFSFPGDLSDGDGTASLVKGLSGLNRVLGMNLALLWPLPPAN